MRGYASYVLSRFGQSVLSIFGVVTIVFFALRLSGDPALLLAPQGATVTQINDIRRTLGLNRPVLTQYFSYLDGLLHGDLGFSYSQHEPVIDIMASRIPVTLELASSAFVLALVFGILVGFVTALHRNSTLDKVLTSVVLGAQAMPVFWSGLLFILVFAVTLRLLPSSGQGGFASLILPAVTLSLTSIATVARVTRTAVVDVLQKPYIRTVRSKGVGTLGIALHHLLRNASVPIVTILALEVANMLGGSVLTETIFAWPGIGQLTVQSVDNRDFPTVQAVVLLVSVVYIVINLIADIAYGIIDPRLTLRSAKARA